MKTENLVFSLCCFFVFLVLIGLCLQSCRSVDTSRNTHSKVKNEVEVASDSTFDSISKHVIFSQDRDFVFTIDRKFQPVMDSTGTVVGNRLLEEKISGSKKISSKFEEKDRSVKKESNSALCASSSSESFKSKEKKKRQINLGWLIFLIAVFFVVRIVAKKV